MFWKHLQRVFFNITLKQHQTMEICTIRGQNETMLLSRIE